MRKTILFLALGVALTSQSLFAQVPSYVPTNGLVGYWPFNGNAYDESGNGNNGTVNQTTLANDRFDNPNKAYVFSGNSNSFITTNYLGIAGIESRTISFWIKTLSTNVIFPVTYGGYPIATQTNAGSYFNCSLNYGGVGANANTGYSAITYDCPTPVNNNQWNHYVWLLERVSNATTQNIKIYQNGILLNNITSNYQPTKLLFTYCGINPLLFGQGVSATLDDIGFWNRALTQQEITNLYNSVSSSECLTMTINTGVLSTNPFTYTSSVSIYPNPANDQITIDCGTLANVSGWSIKITNMQGQEVFSKPMNTQQYVVPLNTWSGQGMYFVKIINAQNEVVNIKKIILH